RKDKAEKEAKIPRPPNAFILFRSDTQPTLVDSFRGAGKSSRDYSASIAKMWAEATPEVKQKYNDLAAEKMYQHRQRYPDYRYRPKR
ncbi:high mobility group box domain-containing protein, partial [Chytriomyces sp. MP71]